MLLPPTVLSLISCITATRLRIFKGLDEVNEDILNHHLQILDIVANHPGSSEHSFPRPCNPNQSIYSNAIKYSFEVARGQKDFNILGKFSSEDSYDADKLAADAAENDFYFLFAKHNHLRTIGGHWIKWLEGLIRNDTRQLLLATGDLRCGIQESIHLYLLSIELGNFPNLFSSQYMSAWSVLHNTSKFNALGLIIGCAIKHKSMETLAIALTITKMFQIVKQNPEYVTEISTFIEGFDEMDYRACSKYFFYNWPHVPCVTKHAISCEFFGS